MLLNASERRGCIYDLSRTTRLLHTLHRVAEHIRNSYQELNKLIVQKRFSQNFQNA